MGDESPHPNNFPLISAQLLCKIRYNFFKQAKYSETNKHTTYFKKPSARVTAARGLLQAKRDCSWEKHGLACLSS